MIGEDPKKKAIEEKARKIEAGEAIDLSAGSDSESEELKQASEEPKQEEPKQEGPKKLTKKQLASRKRAEKYHKQKEAEENLKRKQERRVQHKNVMGSKTRSGQPKLGSQISVLLDKIKEKQ